MRGKQALKILITGSSGLIGSATCPILENKGFKVITMDTRPQPGSKAKPQFGNILDTNGLSAAIRNVEGIIHLAAISRVVDAEMNPELCRLTNVEGLRRLVHIAMKQPKIPWIIFASSREIYGEPLALPVNEQHPLNPINVYGNCKNSCEKLLSDQETQGLRTIIFRFSNVYGSIWDYPTRVIPSFLSGALKQAPIRVDSPSDIFDFTHVNDVVAAISTATEALASKKLQGAKVFNLSPGVGTSLSELLEILKDMTGKGLLQVKGEKRSYDVSRYIGDNAKIHRELGCRCHITLREGLKLLYQDYIDNWGLLY